MTIFEIETNKAQIRQNAAMLLAEIATVQECPETMAGASVADVKELQSFQTYLESVDETMAPASEAVLEIFRQAA